MFWNNGRNIFVNNWMSKVRMFLTRVDKIQTVIKNGEWLLVWLKSKRSIWFVVDHWTDLWWIIELPFEWIEFSIWNDILLLGHLIIVSRLSYHSIRGTIIRIAITSLNFFFLIYSVLFQNCIQTLLLIRF